MTFKGEDAYIKGRIPLELPHRENVEADLVVSFDGSVSFSFSHPEFARDLMVQGLEGRLMAMMLNYSYAVPVERKETDEKEPDDRGGSSTS